MKCFSQISYLNFFFIIDSSSLITLLLEYNDFPVDLIEQFKLLVNDDDDDDVNGGNRVYFGS